MLLATGLTLGRFIAFKVFVPEVDVPVGVIERPLTVIVPDPAALVKVRFVRLVLLVVKAESLTLRIGPPTALLLSVAPAKLGVAVELMFWMVFTAPDVTVKLVELKLEIPLAAVVASDTEMAPAAETDIGATPDTATVPEASGRVMVLAAVGEVKVKVVEFDPLVPRTIELLR